MHQHVVFECAHHQWLGYRRYPVQIQIDNILHMVDLSAVNTMKTMTTIHSAKIHKYSQNGYDVFYKLIFFLYAVQFI